MGDTSSSSVQAPRSGKRSACTLLTGCVPSDANTAQDLQETRPPVAVDIQDFLRRVHWESDTEADSSQRSLPPKAKTKTAPADPEHTSGGVQADEWRLEGSYSPELRPREEDGKQSRGPTDKGRETHVVSI